MTVNGYKKSSRITAAAFEGTLGCASDRLGRPLMQWA